MDISEKQMHEGERPLEPLRQETAPVEARGLGWIVVPALLAAVFGTLIGLVMATRPGPPRLSLLESGMMGAMVGAIAGAAVGVFIWVVFPYKNLPPPPPDAEDEKDENGAVV